MLEVEGEILLTPEMKPFQGVTVRVRLLDVSRADAPARIVAEEEIPSVSHAPGATERVPFRLRASSLNERAHYIVAAHIDVQGTGETQVGDFITMESYPVATFGRPDRVVVRVREVR